MSGQIPIGEFLKNDRLGEGFGGGVLMEVFLKKLSRRKIFSRRGGNSRKER